MTSSSPSLKASIGRRQTRCGGMSRATAEMLSAALPGAWRAGGASLTEGLTQGLTEGLIEDATLPPLWHWAAFPSTEPSAALGEDGHARLGAFIPDAGLPRRMWAGGALQFHAPIHLDEPLTQSTTIVSAARKTGSAGEMAVIVLEHEIYGREGLAVSERQDLVYLARPVRYAPPRPIPAPTAPLLERAEAIDAIRLFRFSAATFNGHRIHYDLDFAREVEKYPGLVTHGPLQAMLLMDLAAAHKGRAPREFRYRAVHPMFHTHDLRLLGVEVESKEGESKEGEDRMALCTAHPETGHQGLQATAVWSAL